MVHFSVLNRFGGIRNSVMHSCQDQEGGTNVVRPKLVIEIRKFHPIFPELSSDSKYEAEASRFPQLTHVLMKLLYHKPATTYGKLTKGKKQQALSTYFGKNQISCCSFTIHELFNFNSVSPIRESFKQNCF